MARTTIANSRSCQDPSGPHQATILPDCGLTLDPRGGLMLLQYRLGFELRRSDVIIMAASVALVVLTIFSF
jgi:hypothetical protein